MISVHPVLRYMLTASIALVCVLLTTGCSSVQYSSAAVSKPSYWPWTKQSLGRAWVLSEDSALLVMPTEAEFSTPAQGLLLQRQLQLALSQVFARVDCVQTDHPQADINAALNNHHYFLVPYLLQQVDRMNSLEEFAHADYSNGVGRDYLQVKLLLHHARTGEILDTTVIEIFGDRLSIVDRDFDNLFFKAFSQYAGQLSAMNAK